MQTIEELKSRTTRSGRIEWIGLRARRRAPVDAVEAVRILEGGLEGDHRDKPGPRAVTLIQDEHLAAVASICGMGALDPALLRRNIAVSGINLLALRGRRFRIGAAVLEATDICAPCSRMEEALGRGGYNAMRGHGGITASVFTPGIVRVGDSVDASKLG